MKSINAVRRFVPKRRRALSLVLVAVLIGIGVALAVPIGGGEGTTRAPVLGAATTHGPSSWVPTVSPPPSIPASAALHRVVVSLKDGRVGVRPERNDLVSARIGAPPRWVKATVVAKAAVHTLYVTEKVPSTKDGGTIEPSWEADLLAGAVAELAGTSKSVQSGLGYAVYNGQLPDGTLIPNLGGGGMGDIARGQQFAGANESDAAITKSVERFASRFGLLVDSVTIFHAWGAAPAVVLTAPDTSAAYTASSKFQPLEDALFGSPPRYEGYYLEIRYADGKPFVRRAVSFLTGTGQLWTGKLPAR